MIPGITGGAFDFAGAAGTTFGGAAGPSTATGGNQSFGGIVSGSGGGFNPFASPGAGQVMQPTSLIILGGFILGAAWILRKK